MRLLSLALVAAVVTALIPATAAAAFPGRNGAIVYGRHQELINSYQDGGGSWDEVYGTWTVGVGLGEPTAVVLARCHEVEQYQCKHERYARPAVSPDGTRVVLSTGTTLLLGDTDGASPVRTLPAPQDASSAAFSPTGAQLVVAARGGLWITDAFGRGARRLTKGFAPVWSTRGWIAFVRGSGLYRIRPDGTGLRRLVAGAYAPAWSPDGTHLALARSRRSPYGGWTPRRGVWVMRSDGEGLHRLAGPTATSRIHDLAWSPDGRALLVAGARLRAIGLRGRLLRVYDELPSEEEIDTDVISSVDWQPLPR